MTTSQFASPIPVPNYPVNTPPPPARPTDAAVIFVRGAGGSSPLQFNAPRAHNPRMLVLIYLSGRCYRRVISLFASPALWNVTSCIDHLGVRWKG